MAGLMRQTTRGLFWSVLDSFGVYVVKFGFSVAIARTLSPDDYGLMGMIVIFISLGQVLMQSGFSAALVQKKEVSGTDLSTAFWFNVTAAAAIWAILFFSAGAIADFFNRPILVSITRVASIGILLNSLCSVHVAILTRELNFRRQTGASLAGTLVSGITGLSLALAGYEVWALVFQTLSGSLIYMAGLWVTSRWRPELRFSIRSFREMFRFGNRIMVQGLLDVIFTKAYFPLIGRLYSAQQLGFYTNANRFYELFIRQASVSVTRVAYPAFAAVQDEQERFNRNYVRSFNMLALVMFLGTVILITGSRPFISLLLTEKWLPAVPFMQIFFLEGFFFPLFIFNQNIMLSLGKSGLFLKIDMVRKAVILLGLATLWKIGIAALIAGQVVSTALAMVLSAVAVVRHQGLAGGAVGSDITRLAIVSAACLVLSFGIIDNITMPDWTGLLVKCTIMPLTFLAGVWLLKVNALHDMRDYIREHVLTRKG